VCVIIYVRERVHTCGGVSECVRVVRMCTVHMFTSSSCPCVGVSGRVCSFCRNVGGCFDVGAFVSSYPVVSNAMNTRRERKPNNPN